MATLLLCRDNKQSVVMHAALLSDLSITLNLHYAEDNNCWF